MLVKFQHAQDILSRAEYVYTKKFENGTNEPFSLHYYIGLYFLVNRLK